MLHAESTGGHTPRQDIGTAFRRRQTFQRLAVIGIGARQLTDAHATNPVFGDAAQLLFQNCDARPVTCLKAVAPEARDLAGLGDMRRPTSGPEFMMPAFEAFERSRAWRRHIGGIGGHGEDAHERRRKRLILDNRYEHRVFLEASHLPLVDGEWMVTGRQPGIGDPQRHHDFLVAREGSRSSLGERVDWSDESERTILIGGLAIEGQSE